MTPPLVSVVIATYNTGRYLPETLESVLAQTYPRREIIVVDDGSTDGTAALMRRLPADVQYVRRAHRGLARARNTGLSLATGDYIALLDADDLWLPDKLAVQVEVAARHPQSGLIACDGIRFGEGIHPARLLYGAPARALDRRPEGEITGDFHRDFIAAVPIGCPGQVLIPRRVIDRVGPFADLLAQDYDYYLRIAQRLPVTLHRHVLVRYRSRRDSLSGPPEDRAVALPLMKIPVLKAHAHRSSPADRGLTNERIAGLVRRAARELYERSARVGRLRTTAAMATLLRARPWPPTALPFLLALWTPAALRRPGARAFHMLRLGGSP
jgi:glycosyltransferase involved in cell wall biosynthesis